MTRLRLLLATTLLLALPAAAATVTGVVRNADAATALPGMSVAAYDATGISRGTASTDASGHYTLTLPAGTYRLLAYDNAGAFATSFFDGAESFDTSSAVTLQSAQSFGANFLLVRAGVIAGTVAAPDTTPVSGITVAVYNLSGTLRGSTQADAAGHYQLVVPPGTFKVAAWDDALAWATTFYADAGSFNAATPISVAAATVSTANMLLTVAAHVRGVVTDGLTGAPVPAAIVTAYDSAGFTAATATTNASGAYDLALRAGSYRIVFEERSGLYASAFYASAESFETATVVTIGAGENRDAVNAALPRAARLEGTVRNAVSGLPLANITVAAYNVSGTVRAVVTTGADGRFSLLVPSGGFKLGAFDPALGYTTRFYVSESSFATALTLHAVAPQQVGGLDLSLFPAVPLHAVVRDITTHEPLAGIFVGAYDAAGNQVAVATTGAAGTIAIALPPGTYRFAAADPLHRYATSFYANRDSFENALAVTLTTGQAELTIAFNLTVAPRDASGRHRSVRH